ncbi:MAG: hypothetical protein NTU97_03610 [Candidatus Magasanikbacteria bacterium]|nr:hypothetical protein [Candidatus Magasanikbacteria bacterium]
MSKKYSLPLLLLVVFVLAGAGCATKQALKNNNGDFVKGNQNREGGNFASSSEFMAGRVKGSLDDLKEGTKVMVMGISNQDGTISASQILIGDFNNFASSTRPLFASSTVGKQGGVPGQRQGGQMQGRQGDGANFGGQRQGGGQGRARMAGQARVIGEILKKDTIGLVIKINDGGSKIVLYSDKTEVFSLSTSTPPNLPQNKTTSTKQ